MTSRNQAIALLKTAATGNDLLENLEFVVAVFAEEQNDSDQSASV